MHWAMAPILLAVILPAPWAIIFLLSIWVPVSMQLELLLEVKSNMLVRGTEIYLIWQD